MSPLTSAMLTHAKPQYKTGLDLRWTGLQVWGVRCLVFKFMDLFDTTLQVHGPMVYLTLNLIVMKWAGGKNKKTPFRWALVSRKFVGLSIFRKPYRSPQPHDQVQIRLSLVGWKKIVENVTSSLPMLSRRTKHDIIIKLKLICTDIPVITW
jgi:hypothetical protein